MDEYLFKKKSIILLFNEYKSPELVIRSLFVDSCDDDAPNDFPFFEVDGRNRLLVVGDVSFI
jgi:hypothetical protein